MRITDRFPFLHNATEIGPDTLRITVDPKQQLFLSHHHHLMPATVIMEHFCQAASWFGRFLKNDHQALPVKLEGFTVERAIAFNGDTPLTLDIVCKNTHQKKNNLSLDMEILSARMNKSGKHLGVRRNAMCTVTFVPDLTARQQVPVLEGAITNYNFAQPEFYEHFYQQHGPLFQTISGEICVTGNADYLLGSYDCKDKESQWIQDINASFILSPLGYDSCLQYMALQSILSDFKPRLPVAANEIICYRPHPKSGTCKALIKKRTLDGEQMTSDIYCFDTNNNLLMEMRGFKLQGRHQSWFDTKTLKAVLAKNRLEDTIGSKVPGYLRLPTPKDQTELRQ